MSRRPFASFLAVAVSGVVLAVVVLGACSDPRFVADSEAPADSVAGELPFRMVGIGGAAIAVPVSINGHPPVDLILDTGATLTCIDSGLAREWGLPEQRLTGGIVVGIGASGGVRMHRVDSVRVGAAVARRLSVCSMDLQALRTVSSDVRGLLGLNVLRNFRMTLDFDRRVLRLAPPGD